MAYNRHGSKGTVWWQLWWFTDNGWPENWDRESLKIQNSKTKVFSTAWQYLKFKLIKYGF